jgi:RHS repeat-associated protein
MLQDRQGSVMARAGDSTALERHDYFPYGEERTPSIGDRNKFGTYHRDQTGLDYADQRYYNSAIGRFLSADPLIDTTRDAFSYAGSDPVNFIDPRGTARIRMECNTAYLRYVSIAEGSECFYGNGGGPDPFNPFRQGDAASMARYNAQVSATWMAAWGNALIGSGNIGAALSLVATNPYIEVSVVSSRITYCAPTNELCQDPVSGHAVPNPNGPIGLQDDFGTLADVLGAFSPPYLAGATLLRRNLLQGASDDVLAAAANLQAHHWFPQQFRTEFSNLGINIDFADFGSFLSTAQHQLIHVQGYNNRWMGWFERNVNASREDAIRFMEELKEEFLRLKP